MDAHETRAKNNRVEAPGFLNVHKPKGMTSHDVVSRVRRALGVKHVGHGGTLDPLAEGVLPIGVGAACRLFRFLPHDKIYLADVLLGRRTTTDDILGDEIVSEASGAEDGQSGPPYEVVARSLLNFQGKIKQRPPQFSALHKDGKRLYELARQGIVVEVEERDVEISEITLVSYEFPRLRLRIACGGGTYIRSIARDLGELLGCGGCLEALVREKSGPFVIADAIVLDQFSKSEDLVARIQTPLSVLAKGCGLDVLDLNEREKTAITCGKKLSLASLENGTSDLQDVPVVLASFANKLVAVCLITEDGLIKPEVVLSNAR